MPSKDEPGWRLEGFLERLDAWAERESPSGDLKLLVTAWIMTRYEDPYQGMRRERGFPNLWFGSVPHSEVAGTTVVCTYWIEESARTVRCDGFATLNLPI
jgi:hypothetical protein